MVEGTAGSTANVRVGRPVGLQTMNERELQQFRGNTDLVGGGEMSGTLINNNNIEEREIEVPSGNKVKLAPNANAELAH